jgi:hypothetical protein
MCYFPTHKETHDVKTVVNDDKFDRGSLEPTGSQKEKITNNRAFSKVLIIDDDPDVTTVFSLGLQDEAL